MQPKGLLRVITRTLLFPVVISLIVGGCVGPKTTPVVIDPAKLGKERQRQDLFAFEQWRAQQIRLGTISYPLLIAGADLCGKNVRPALGLFLWNSSTIPLGLRGIATERYGVSTLPQIYAVIPNTPAAIGGLKVGDRILRLGKQRVFGGELGMRVLQQAAYSEAKVGRPLLIRVRRGKEDDEFDFNIVPIWRCNFNPVLSRSNEIEAHADGKNVVVSQGMMEFARSDQHLAVIVAHEISHNAMGHIDAKKKNVQVGALVGLLFDIAGAALGVDTGGTFSDAGAKAGGLAYSVEFEQEADYVGLHLLARAGYPLDGASDVWRRLGAKNPKIIRHRRTHPTTPERFLAMEQHIVEIRNKVAKGQPLIPEGLENSKTIIARQQIAVAPESLQGTTSRPAQENKGLALARPTNEQNVAPKIPKRWVGREDSDACGKPWAMSLTLTKGQVKGTFWRGGIEYDVLGFLDAAGNMVGVRGGKNKFYRNYVGPRLVVFNITFGADEARGKHHYGSGRCITPMRLVPDTK